MGVGGGGQPHPPWPSVLVDVRSSSRECPETLPQANPISWGRHFRGSVPWPWTLSLLQHKDNFKANSEHDKNQGPLEFQNSATILFCLSPHGKENELTGLCDSFGDFKTQIKLCCWFKKKQTKAGPHVPHHGLKFLRMTLNSRPSCLHLPGLREYRHRPHSLAMDPRLTSNPASSSLNLHSQFEMTAL